MEPQNPYAPPRSNVEPVAATRTATRPHGLKTRPVILLIVLTFITYGYYAIYWLYQASRELSADLPRRDTRAISLLFVSIMLGAIDLALFVAVFVAPDSNDLAGLERMVSFAFAVVQIAWSFNVRALLQSLVARRGVGPYPISASATFFFGLFYLQYKINRLPERSASSDFDDEDDEP